jgi:hypothetical protein
MKIRSHLVMKLELHLPFYAYEEIHLMQARPQGCCFSLSGEQPFNLNK